MDAADGAVCGIIYVYIYIYAFIYILYIHLYIFAWAFNAWPSNLGGLFCDLPDFNNASLRLGVCYSLVVRVFNYKPSGHGFKSQLSRSVVGDICSTCFAS